MLQAKVVESYCTSLEALGRAKRTIGTNKERLEDFQKFLLGQDIKEIERINPEIIDAYISSSYRKGLSVFTVAGRVQVIKHFFSWSVKRNFLQESPANHLRKPHLDHSAKDKAILQEDLEAMIFFARKTKKIMVETMLMILADTGCRSGELCGIDIGDIDFGKKEVFIDGKTGKRLLDFTDKTTDILQVYMKLRKQKRLSTSAFFLHDKNGRITTNQVYVRFRKIGEVLGIKIYKPQAIRHRVGQGWLDQGANLEIVRQKLGHKDIQTTALYYSHQDRERLKKATKNFSLVKGL